MPLVLFHLAPLTRRFAAPSPRFAGRGNSREILLPAGGEKVAGGQMRGLQKILQFTILPLATIQTYKSANITPNKLVHAHNM